MTVTDISRRSVVSAWLALPAAAPLVASIGEALAQTGELPLTPQCGAAATPAQTEGPFFTPETPEKRSFRGDGRPGEPITLIGLVLDRACRPVPGALIELWHADAGGAYDNRGYALRGHQYSDSQGRYVFETIVPGLYPGRTRHFHVKVGPRRRGMLTTQLYFPDEPDNRRDGIFDPRLTMRITQAGDGKVGRFDFVVQA